MHLMLRKTLREEAGFSLAATLGAIVLISMLVTVSLAIANGDLRLTGRDLDTKRAYAAAQAGIIDYAFHLNNDSGYWADCTNVPGEGTGQAALNQAGSTTVRRTVLGSTDGSQYAIELLPASTYTGTPKQCSTQQPVESMLEQSGTNAGTFRIRSTGFSGSAKRSIVATFKQASFLDYVYFTQYETSDPVTYGFANPSTALTGANTQCTKFRRDGREDAKIPGTGSGTPYPTTFCDQIVFVGGDNIQGPIHTNDDLAICGSPTFGRSASDVTEVSAPPTGWGRGNNCTANPNFVAPLVPNSPILVPPATNGDLKTIAGPSYTYTGQTKIDLNGSSMRINGGPLVPIPVGGVLYVANGSCSTSYSPFTVTYPTTSGCGNAIVHSSSPYTGQLTIAAENDIILDGNIQRASGSSGLLGLVANNFVRVKHPVCESTDPDCKGGTTVSGSVTEQAAKGDCDADNDSNRATDGNGTTKNIQIDAAILAIDHSFIVDHYDCGGDLGTLNVTGAIAQKFRGAVGTTGGTGYKKNYVYDDRLRFQEPPHGFDPVKASWHVERETLDFP
jgi:Tfp pilus assembly protein PilX